MIMSTHQNEAIAPNGKVSFFFVPKALKIVRRPRCFQRDFCSPHYSVPKNGRKQKVSMYGSCPRYCFKNTKKNTGKTLKKNPENDTEWFGNHTLRTSFHVTKSIPNDHVFAPASICCFQRDFCSPHYSVPKNDRKQKVCMYGSRRCGCFKNSKKNNGKTHRMVRYPYTPHVISRHKKHSK